MAKTPALDLAKHWAPLHSQGFTGAGVTMGVLDTGADASTYERAREMNENARRFAHFDVKWGRIEKLWPTGNAVPADLLKHGSAVFLRLLGGAPSVFFLDIRTLFPNTSEQELQQSLRVAVDRGADVLNLSMGRMVPWSQTEEHLLGCSVCRYASQLLADHDILVVAAAGNWADQAMACPGVSPDVLAVGAVMTDEESAFYVDHPEQKWRDFFEGRSSTSYAAAMTSALFAILRSAFPAIPARDWLEFSRSNSAASGVMTTYEPEGMFSELREICAGRAFNFNDWKEFGQQGITNRRELLARANGVGVEGYAKIREWLKEQRELFRTFIEGQFAFAEGRKLGGEIRTVSKAIEQFVVAVSKFEQIGQPIRTAAARLSLGAQLVNRSWHSLPGRVIVNDAAEAERELSQACNELNGCSHPRRQVLEGCALAWRARARTVLASVSPVRNEEALTDAKKAVELLSSAPGSPAVQHDLAIAHLHLARCHYFFTWHLRQTGRSTEEHSEQLRKNALRALELDQEDSYARADANWLLQNS